MLNDDYPEITVSKDEDVSWNDDGSVKERKFTGKYTVSLPHQCNEWEIVSSEPKEQAIKTMEKFIEECKKALEELKNL